MSRRGPHGPVLSHYRSYGPYHGSSLNILQTTELIKQNHMTTCVDGSGLISSPSSMCHTMRLGETFSPAI